MRWVWVSVLAVSVRELHAAPDVARSHEQLWADHEHEREAQKQVGAALSATLSELDAAVDASETQLHEVSRRVAALERANVDGESLATMNTREMCFRACAPGAGGERWKSDTKLTRACNHMIQARQLKEATLEAMEFNEKGTGLLPIEYGAWSRSWNDEASKQFHSFMPSNIWRKGITWDDVVNSTAAAAAAAAFASPSQPRTSTPWTPPSCVMGTHFGGSDGLGMNIERTMIGNVIALLLGCPAKCAPILSRIRHSAVYAHHSDGTTTYCHHAGNATKDEKKRETKAIAEYTKLFAFNKNQMYKNREHDDAMLPKFWLENMRCHNISHFQRQLSNIVPCWSADIATGLPDATMFDPPSLSSKHDVLTKLFELPRSPQNLVTWNKRVAEARALILKVREQNRKSKRLCTFARHSPAGTPGAPVAAKPAARTAKVLTIAVHIRNGDIAKRAMTRLQLCFVRRVCGVLHSNGFRTEVRVHSETHRASPTAAGTFPEFGDMLIFEPYPNGTDTPPWCGDGAYHHAFARLRGLPATPDEDFSTEVDNGNRSIGDHFLSALDGVLVTLNGNPVNDIMCMADANILISGVHSSFSGISTTLSSGIKLRFPGKNARNSGAELRQMLWKLIPEDVHLEYDYPQECYDNDTGKLSETCKGGDDDWGTCPPMHFDDASFMHEVNQRHI